MFNWSPNYSKTPVVGLNSEKYTERAEELIRRNLYVWVASIEKNDPSVSKWIFADDFVWHPPSGEVRGKKDAVDEAKELPTEYRGVRVDYLSIKVAGDGATVEGSETWEKLTGEQGRLSFKSNWKCNGGQWQIKEWRSRNEPLLK